MINLLERQKIIEKLDQLSSDKRPVFGLMTPQHMVEHLGMLFKISNGKIFTKLYQSEETAKRWKEVVIHTAYELQPGFKAPILPKEKLTELNFDDLQTAKDFMMIEMGDFLTLHSENPHREILHPVLGNLNLDEWLIFHNKHLTHHFKQFELI